jgi:hypothetical protein
VYVSDMRQKNILNWQLTFGAQSLKVHFATTPVVAYPDPLSSVMEEDSA